MDDSRQRAQQDARARLRWRHTEDPLIVEAAECAEGWRHLTVARPVDDSEEFPPALARLFAEFPRLRGRPHALCGGTDGDRRVIVVALGPPDAEQEIDRLYRLACGLNPGDWEVSHLGRPVSCPLP